MRTRPAPIVVLTASLATAALGGCSSTPAGPPAVTATTPPVTASAGTTPGTTPGSTPGTTRGTTSGSTVGTALPPGSCPQATELTVNLKAGTRVIQPKVGWADLRGKESVQVLLATYDAPRSEAETVWQPNLTGDQVGVELYVSATQGTTLEPGTYQRVTTNRDTTKQFNTLLVYSGAGREIASGFAKAPNQVTITKIDDTVVCGTVETDEATGVFRATRI